MRVLQLHFPRDRNQPCMGATFPLLNMVEQSDYDLVDLQAAFWVNPRAPSLWTEVVQLPGLGYSSKLAWGHAMNGNMDGWLPLWKQADEEYGLKGYDVILVELRGPEQAIMAFAWAQYTKLTHYFPYLLSLPPPNGKANTSAKAAYANAFDLILSRNNSEDVEIALACWQHRNFNGLSHATVRARGFLIRGYSDPQSKQATPVPCSVKIKTRSEHTPIAAVAPSQLPLAVPETQWDIALPPPPQEGVVTRNRRELASTNLLFLSGWITSEGRFYPCGWTEHIRMLSALGHTNDVEGAGWIKVSPSLPGNLGYYIGEPSRVSTAARKVFLRWLETHKKPLPPWWDSVEASF